MKKAMHFVLDEEEIIELIRILMDEDAEGALVFLKTQEAHAGRMPTAPIEAPAYIGAFC